MTKITLRSYNREIETLTDQGKIDLAIAHSLHVLKYFPKHVDTYRLLGKAYLENRRLGDAADIFQRVLSAIPDDFVAHIGMSIIREDEGNLDAAIWHMQRAYDVQSSNITIQDELRRLYNKRDGIEPPKIRLTRAALARMYARGDLINEAIAELRSALQEEPDRADLLVLLARMYYTNNQRVKSIQSSSQVLNKLPYCLDANIIISQALTDTNRADEAVQYTDKAKELDPYAAYISENAPTLNLVPDAAVTLIKLDESEIGSTKEQPDWVASLGDELPPASSEEEVDWLLDTEAGEETTIEEASALEHGEEAFTAFEEFEFDASSEEMAIDDDAPTSPEETLLAEDTSSDLPDWMQDAGWSQQVDEAEEEAILSPENAVQESEEGAADALEPAEIPDWLQEMAPESAAESTDAEEESGETFESFDPDATQASVDIPDWLKDLDVEDDITLVPTDEETTAAQELPDWLGDLEGSPEDSEEVPSSESDIPDWLSDIVSEEDQQSAADETDETGTDLPDWLGELEQTDEDEPLEAIEAEETARDLPEWVMGDEETQSLETDITASEAVDQGDSTDEELPEWLQELDIDEETPVLDDTAALMEALNSEMSAEETAEDAEVQETEIAIPDSFESSETATSAIPDWLQELNVQDDETVPDEAVMETASIDEDMDNWLASMENPEAEAADPEESDALTAEASEEATEEDLPNWLEEMAKRAGESSATTSDRTGVSLWLRRGEQDDEAPEEETETETPQMAEETPAQEVPAEEIEPEAMDTVQTDRPPELEALAEDADAAAEEEVPGWLQGLDDELLSEKDEAAMEEDEEDTSPTIAIPEESEEEAVEMTDIPDVNDTDAAMRWLESLAAKQGAKEEELLTSPEERTDTPPEWVQQMATAAGAELQEEEGDEALPSEPVATEMEAKETAIQEDTLDWGDETILAEETIASEVVAPEEEPVEEASMQEIVGSPFDEEPESTQVDETEVDMSETDDQADEVPAWPNEENEEMEQPVEAASDIPGWLQDVEIEEEPELEEPESADAAEIPVQQTDESEAADETYVWEPDQAEESEPQTESGEWTKDTGPLDADDVSTEQSEPEPVSDQEQKAAAAPISIDLLSEARAALEKGDIEESLSHYKTLIKKKRNLDEIIVDLNQALQRNHPVNIDVWTALGDAYAKNDNIQKALDAYTKAEELIR